MSYFNFFWPRQGNLLGIRVIRKLGNTIFGALFGERPVDWGIIVKDLV